MPEGCVTRVRLLLFVVFFGRLRKMYPEWFDGPRALENIEAAIAAVAAETATTC